MTFARIGGAAAMIGGVAWLALFWSGNEGTPIAWLEGVMWTLPLAFGLGVMGLYSTGRSTFSRVAVVVAGGVSIAAAAAIVVGSALGLTDAAGYAAWLVFVGGTAALLCLVLAFGARNRRTLVGLVALIGSGLPVAFLAMILVYKVLTGWWVTDPDLVAFGTVGAAILIGGAWVALGAALIVRPPGTERPEQAPSTG